MRTHLLIMNGPEMRDAIIEMAIRVSEPVFDSIKIIQNGFVEGHHNPIIEKYVDWSFPNFIGYIAAYEILLLGIEEGDHFLILDSDEVPSPELLAFIKARNFDPNYNTWGMQFMHHQHYNDGIQDYITDSRETFCPARFFRYERGLQAKTWLGAHQAYQHKENKYVGTNLHINHIKHDFSILLSAFAHGVNSPESVGISKGLELETILEVKNRYNISPSFIYKKFEDKELFRSIKRDLSAIDKSSETSYIQIQQAVDFVLNTHKSLLELNRFMKCPQECCKYV